jgi:hypothetical protein
MAGGTYEGLEVEAHLPVEEVGAPNVPHDMEGSLP